MDEVTPASNKVSHGWIAYLDVFGFTSMIREQDNSEVADKLLHVHRACQPDLEAVDHHQFFSDSIFVYSHHDDTEEGGGSDTAFQSVAGAVRSLIKHSFNANMFLRGSLAYGHLNIRENIILGKPLIRAYALEQRLPYPIVIVPELELELGGIPHELPVIEVSTKQGLISAAVIIPHSRNRMYAVANERARETAKAGPDHVALAWRHYMELLQRLGYGRKGSKQK